MTAKPKRQRQRQRQRKLDPPTFELIPENWTDDQALAVYDFCSALQEHVWRRYHDALIDPMLLAQLQAKAAKNRHDRTRPLPFDDPAL